MPTYAVHYTYIDDAAERDRVRPAHREFLAELPELLAAGSYAPHEDPGALLLFRADSPEALDRALADDPFRTENVVTAMRIVEWRPVLGPASEQLKSH